MGSDLSCPWREGELAVRTYDYDDILNEELKDPEFRRAYDESEQEFDEIRKGILEAIAFAEGDTTGAVAHMPSDKPLLPHPD